MYNDYLVGGNLTYTKKTQHRILKWTLFEMLSKPVCHGKALTFPTHCWSVSLSLQVLKLRDLGRRYSISVTRTHAHIMYTHTHIQIYMHTHTYTNTHTVEEQRWRLSLGPANTSATLCMWLINLSIYLSITHISYHIMPIREHLQYIQHIDPDVSIHSTGSWQGRSSEHPYVTLLGLSALGQGGIFTEWNLKKAFNVYLVSGHSLFDY
jgi:hypothetical protein